MKAPLPQSSRWRFGFTLRQKSIGLFLHLTLLTLTARAADDAYWRWAAAHFGHAVASDPAQRATIWGEHADPDRDGFENLAEYAADTDPLQRTESSDVSTFQMTAGNSPASHAQLLAWQRTDDPDLRFICQTSTDLANWLPPLPVDLTQPAPPNPFVFESETGALARGVRQMRYTDTLPLANRPAAFLRVCTIRRGVISLGSAIEQFFFTSQPSTKAGSVVRSNAITLAGFTGTLTFTIPAGVTLYVNGVAVTGSVAVVKAGDHLWMEAYAPGTPGVPRHFDLTIGGHTARWTITAAALASVPTGSAALPSGSGPESGYTPVEAGVSDTGAAQISIPIVVSPGTAGMQPKLAISYSSQAGNGPLGLGFSLSGLSAISRTGATVAQDGFKGGIAFDANDRFALDGQRVVLDGLRRSAIAGADGAHGTEYRLEFDPTSRIYSLGIENGSPQQWTVETKAGLKLRFGSTVNNLASSRIRPEGSLSVLSWAVSEIEDSAGNAIARNFPPHSRSSGRKGA